MPIKDPVKRKLYHKKYWPGYYKRNRNKYIIKQTKWIADNPEKKKQYNRVSQLKRYGLSLEDYKALLVKQGLRCLICKNLTGSNLCVDHNHRTGKVRGLLCGPCNMALGLLQVDSKGIKLLLEAIQYLNKRV